MIDWKENTYDWLAELENEKVIKFLEDCKIALTYVSTMVSMDSDIEFDMVDVIVNIPLLKHRIIEKYEEEIQTIESAISESALIERIYVRSISWIPYLKNKEKTRFDIKGEEVTLLLTDEYVEKQILLMNNSIENNPHVALGIAKELIETCCKHILNKSGIERNNNWNVSQLLKETNRQIELIPSNIENSELATTSIRKILSGFSNIVHGVTELRNSFGSGHGHLPEFKPLEKTYIQLAVAASSEMVRFYLDMNLLNDYGKLEQ